MQIITSKDNENIKSIKKLKERKYRDLNNEYIIEGIKILKEAIQEKAVIKKIVICEECLANNIIDEKLLYEIAKYDCLYVSKKIFEGLTDVSKPQGILAVVEKNNKKDINYNEDIIVALDGLQDPGNLGTILRTLDSANLSQVVVSKDTVDAYNPKVVRSTMGAIFRVNIVETENLKETLKEMKRHKYKVMCTDLTASKNIYEVDYTKKILVIGNESNGISKELLDMADEKIIIPMLGKTESLNASVATSIIVYEYVRRKIGIRIEIWVGIWAVSYTH
uniref:TrmH family RNA methyltransferase n=1 Tax=Candidatus Merdicola sp. TaxID=3085652 RepID=UPI003FEE4B4D